MQVKEDTCYVSDDFYRDMNVARYVLSHLSPFKAVIVALTVVVKA